MIACLHRAAALLLATAALLVAAPRAGSGVLDADGMRRAFPPPLVVGEKDRALPAWPIFKQNGPSTDLIGYAFESIDLAPIPGFSGSPIDLLVAIDPDGRFLDVRVLSHHEPVFLDGLGAEPMLRFVGQYRGLALKQNIRIAPAGTGGRRDSPNSATIDGVAKATASVRIIHQSVLAAALRVARAKLGYSGASDPDLVAHVRTDLAGPPGFAGLARAGLAQHFVASGQALREAFAATAAADTLAGIDRNAPFIDLHVALASVPAAGRTLFDARGWQQLLARTRDGDHVLFVQASGPWQFADDDFVRGAVPERLQLSQGGLPVEMRDLDLDATLVGDAPHGAWKAFRIIAQAGLDPGQPFELAARVTRAHGALLPERVTKEFRFSYRLPGAYFIPGAEDQKGWLGTWKSRAAEIALTLAATVLLLALLARNAALVARTRALHRFRPAFLLFTLGFIGWYAQGQLSIVNVIALLQAAMAGRSWAFFLFDPISTVLWIAVAVTLFAWGRGTFCGWLCPFGALQELVAGTIRPLLARLRRTPAGARLPALPLRVPARADRLLRPMKYVLLAAILAAAVISPRIADALVEAEPFKTAITLSFVRSWPYVLYAVVLLAAAVILTKPFCRYLCPLGAGLAALDVARRRRWIPRLAECGTPCQSCRYRCEYQAIDAAGAIDYRECFQCMECVAIYHDDTRCAPRILQARGRAAIRLHVQAPAASAASAKGNLDATT